MGTLTVIKTVQNLHGGNNVISDFLFFVDDGIVSTQVLSGATTTLPTGAYNVSETGVSGYVGTYGGDCDAIGNVTVTANQHKVCTINNVDLVANITLIAVATGTPPLVNPTVFQMFVDGTPVPNNTSIGVTSNSAHVITQTPRSGYVFQSLTGSPQCPAVLGGTATLSEGQAITCTITNLKL
jgi:hypothetical protein